MKIETKYDIGQQVFSISQMRHTRKKRCTTCLASGRIVHDGEVFHCPKCHGECLVSIDAGNKNVISYEGKIGNIKTEHTETKYCFHGDSPTKIQYMLDCTGVGSGTLWNEEDLWPTREAAQDECDRRNAMILPDDSLSNHV